MRAIVRITKRTSTRTDPPFPKHLVRWSVGHVANETRGERRPQAPAGCRRHPALG